MGSFKEFWSQKSNGPDVGAVMLAECIAMVAFASSRGLSLPGKALVTVEAATNGAEATLPALATAHGQLATVVAPATPSTIKALADKAATRFTWLRPFGATTYARWLLLLAVLTFGGFLLLLAANQDDKPAANEQLWLTAVAALVGAVLYVLFNNNQQVRAATIDKSQEGIYTAYIALGVLSGTALAFLVVRPESTTDADGSVGVVFTRPLIALLGGFSVDAVYRILQRLVTTLNALVKGSAEEQVAAERQAARARMATDMLNTRAALAAKLIEIQKTLADPALPDEARQKIAATIAELLPAADL